MYLLAPFILKNFKKILRTHTEFLEFLDTSRGCAIFWPKMAQLSSTKIFLLQIIIITFIYLLALFIV